MCRAGPIESEGAVPHNGPMSTGSIHLISTGEVQVRPKNIAGDRTPMLWWTFTSRRWSDPLPVYAALVEHERGNVLWDTGQSIDSVTQPDYYPGGLLGAVYRRQARFSVTPEQDLIAQLDAAGFPASSLAFVVVSHLHQDHAGNVARLAGVPVLVSAAEHALLSEKQPELHGVLARHVGGDEVDYRPITFSPTQDDALAPFGGAHDIHGDGSLVLLPTPGHSVGSMSLLVRRAGQPPVLLVGDVTYDPDLLARGIVPGTGARAVQLETARRIADLTARLPGLVVIAAHDPRAPQRLAGAS